MGIFMFVYVCYIDGQIPHPEARLLFKSKENSFVLAPGG